MHENSLPCYYCTCAQATVAAPADASPLLADDVSAAAATAAAPVLLPPPLPTPLPPLLMPLSPPLVSEAGLSRRHNDRISGVRAPARAGDSAVDAREATQASGCIAPAGKRCVLPAQPPSLSLTPLLLGVVPLLPLSPPAAAPQLLLPTPASGLCAVGAARGAGVASALLLPVTPAAPPSPLVLPAAGAGLSCMPPMAAAACGLLVLLFPVAAGSSLEARLGFVPPMAAAACGPVLLPAAACGLGVAVVVTSEPALPASTEAMECSRPPPPLPLPLPPAPRPAAARSRATSCCIRMSVKRTSSVHDGRCRGSWICDIRVSGREAAARPHAASG